MDIDKRIHSDWFELRQIYDNVFTLDEYLHLENSTLKSAQEELRLSVEEGLLQYKTALLSGAQEFIEALKFDTRHFDQLENQTTKISLLLFIILIQRLFATGNTALSRQEQTESSVNEEMKEKDLKVIMEELRKMAADDPSFTQRQEVKTILLQFRIYQKELEELKKLKANIPKDKLPSLLANFQKTFSVINQKIQDNYNKIMEEEIRVEVTAPPPGDLRNYQLKEMAPLMLKQGEAASKLRSMFQFAKEERYNTRDIFSNSLKEIETLRSLFVQERGLMGRWEQKADGAILVSKGFSEEVTIRLGKLLSNR